MKKFYVMIRDSVDYEVEAETEEDAIESALEWWAERNPDIFVDNDEESEK